MNKDTIDKRVLVFEDNALQDSLFKFYFRKAGLVTHIFRANTLVEAQKFTESIRDFNFYVIGDVSEDETILKIIDTALDVYDKSKVIVTLNAPQMSHPLSNRKDYDFGLFTRYLHEDYEGRVALVPKTDEYMANFIKAIKRLT